MNQVKTTEMPLLEQRLADSITQFCILVDFVSLSSFDMDLNTQTFQWLNCMPSIYEKHQKIIAENTETLQEDLKVSSLSIYYI